MSLVVGTFTTIAGDQVNKESVEFTSTDTTQDLQSVLIGLSNVQTQFKDHLTNALHLTFVEENDEIPIGGSDDEEGDELEKPVVRKTKKAKK